jgi:hypothetical protein
LEYLGNIDILGEAHVDLVTGKSSVDFHDMAIRDAFVAALKKGLEALASDLALIAEGEHFIGMYLAKGLERPPITGRRPSD